MKIQEQIQKVKAEINDQIMRFEITARAEDNPHNQEVAKRISECWEMIRPALLHELDLLKLIN